METSHDDGPRCPIHDKLLVCRTCFSIKIGKLGGSAGTDRQKRAHAKVAKNLANRKKRSAKMRLWWENRYAARAAVSTWAEVVTEVAALELAARAARAAALEAPAPPAPPAPTLEDAHTETSSPGEEPPLTVTAEPPTEPPAVEHQEPVDEPAPPVQAQVPADRRTALSAALAARRGR